MVSEVKCKGVKPKSARRLWINLMVVALVGVFSGFGIGMWMNSNKVDPNLYNIDVSKLYDNVSTIRKEATGKLPTQLGAVKSAVLAFDNTFNHEKVLVEGTGSVVAMGFTQSIKSKSIRIGNKVFSENISTGSVVSAANRFYLNGSVINHVTGNINGNQVTWNAGNEEIANETYKEQSGGGLNEYMLYIVSSKTVQDSSAVEVDENGNYKFVLYLDKVNSVIKYVKNMKSTGGLSTYPEFRENIKLSFIVDSSYRLVEVKSEEKYGAKKAGIPITAESTGVLTNRFYYDGDFVIPAVGEKTEI